MAEESGEVFDAALVDVILPLVDGLAERLRSGADVADFGCGSGHAVNVMARAFPASRFTGVDFSDEAIAVGAGRRPASAWRTRRSSATTSPQLDSQDEPTTSSPRSTPSTTRLSRLGCWTTSTARCGPAACS